MELAARHFKAKYREEPRTDEDSCATANWTTAVGLWPRPLFACAKLRGATGRSLVARLVHAAPQPQESQWRPERARSAAVWAIWQNSHHPGFDRSQKGRGLCAMHCQRNRKVVPLDGPFHKRGREHEVKALPVGDVNGCAVSILLWPYQVGHLQGLFCRAEDRRGQREETTGIHRCSNRVGEPFDRIASAVACTPTRRIG